MKGRTRSKRTSDVVALGLAALVALAGADPASGQRAPAQSSPVGAVIGAIVGGAAGFVGGAYLGAQGDCYEICEGLVYGALGGQVLGVALGAHAGNGGRGSLAADLGISLASVALGVAGSSMASDGTYYVMSMVAQVAAVAATEIKTSPDVTVTAGPRFVADHVGLGVSITW